MSNPISSKQFALGSLAVIALAASQGAFAHTRLETSTVVEGTKVHNYVVIGHGCPPTTARKATYGVTVVFPSAGDFTPIIGVNDGSTGIAGVAGAVYVDPSKAPASSFYSPQVGLAAAINGGGAWTEGNIKVDSKNNKDGFWAGGRHYDQTISTNVLTPFFSSAVTIAAASCARTVTFYPAIADVCDVSVPSTEASDEQVLYWSPIPNFQDVPGQPFGAPTADAARKIVVGPKYSNFDGYKDAAHTIPGDGWNSPASYKVTRNLTTNPLPTTCTGNGGKGDDVYVFPSAEQINKELPVWSKPDQTGVNHWK